MPATPVPRRPAPVAATPMAFVRAMVWALRRARAGAAQVAAVLEAGQITPAELKRADARITAAQMESVSAAAMRALDDEALGWFARRWPWGSHGLLCRGSLGAPNLGVALARWCRHHALFTDDIALHLQVQGGEAVVSVAEHRRWPQALVREFCLLTTLRNVHGIASWLIDSRLPLAEAAFPFAPPPHAEVYGLLFPGAVRFRAPQAALRFDAAVLAEPLRRDEAALRQMLQRPLVLTVKPYRRERRLGARVQALLAREAAELRSAEALAARLHTSVRTLHRRLREEGTSLQALKDAARRERACELLLRSARPVKQVAQEAGFASEKSFIRAFAGWMGEPPAAWRARMARRVSPAGPVPAAPMPGA